MERRFLRDAAIDRRLRAASEGEDRAGPSSSPLFENIARDWISVRRRTVTSGAGSDGASFRRRRVFVWLTLLVEVGARTVRIHPAKFLVLASIGSPIAALAFLIYPYFLAFVQSLPDDCDSVASSAARVVRATTSDDFPASLPAILLAFAR